MQRRTIINGQSIDIIACINRAFDRVRADEDDLLADSSGRPFSESMCNAIYRQYPVLKQLIDHLDESQECNEEVYETLVKFYQMLVKTKNSNAALQLWHNIRNKLDTLANDEINTINHATVSLDVQQSFLDAANNFDQGLISLKDFTNAVGQLLIQKKSYLQNLEFQDVRHYTIAKELAGQLREKVESDTVEHKKSMTLLSRVGRFKARFRNKDLELKPLLEDDEDDQHNMWRQTK